MDKIKQQLVKEVKALGIAGVTGNYFNRDLIIELIRSRDRQMMQRIVDEVNDTNELPSVRLTNIDSICKEYL